MYWSSAPASIDNILIYALAIEHLQVLLQYNFHTLRDPYYRTTRILQYTPDSTASILDMHLTTPAGEKALGSARAHLWMANGASWNCLS